MKGEESFATLFIWQWLILYQITHDSKSLTSELQHKIVVILQLRIFELSAGSWHKASEGNVSYIPGYLTK